MTDINGNEWPQEWISVYNALSRLIESTYGEALREQYLNERHVFYVLCTNILAEG